MMDARMNVFLSFFFILASSAYAMHKDDPNSIHQKQRLITHFFKPSTKVPVVKISASITPATKVPVVKVQSFSIPQASSSAAPEVTSKKRFLPSDQMPPAVKKPKMAETPLPYASTTALYHNKQALIKKAPQPLQMNALSIKNRLPLPLQAHSSSVKGQHQLSHTRRLKEIEPEEMEVCFLHGKDEHIQAYADCIDDAETEIIIASWNLSFIPKQLFSSLLRAKKKGVHISFVVNSVRRKEALDYFVDEEDEDKDDTFHLFETKSHAKFIFVDKKYLVLGSFNALGESFEESEDASIMLEGSIKQLWPFYMSLYQSYIDIGEDLGGIFDGIAMISKVRNPKERELLQRVFKDGSKIFLLRNIKEHEDFFKSSAISLNSKVTIYSPFSAKDNTLKRLQMLESLVPAGTEVCLKVLQQFEKNLQVLLSSTPDLKSHTRVEVARSHQKVVIAGNQTICIGSLNWLSAAQSATDLYSNVEFSIVLLGPKAEEFIQAYY